MNPFRPSLSHSATEILADLVQIFLAVRPCRGARKNFLSGPESTLGGPVDC
jgi:hypothetical protein